MNSKISLTLHIYSSHADTEQLWWELEEMDWEETPTSNDKTDKVFKDVADSTFHEFDSQLENIPEDQLLQGDGIENGDCPFMDVADCTFHGSDSLLENIPEDQLIQLGEGEPDYNIKLLNERALKSMGVRDVNYELTFSDRIISNNKRMVDMKNIIQKALQEMLNHAKKHLHPGDIMRGVIYNDHLDLPIYIPCRKMEDMTTEIIMESLASVLNSNEDIPLDSSSHFVLGAIKYPRGGKGLKFTSLHEKICKKKSIVHIRNKDNLCLVRAALVSLASLSKASDVELKKCKSEHPTLSRREIFLRFQKCTPSYYQKIRDNQKKIQDLLAENISEELNISGAQPLTYQTIPLIEDYLNLNVYVISARLCNRFSYVSQNGDTERKKIFLYHVDEEDLGHFHAVVNIAGFFSSSYFCLSCLKPHNSKTTHNCVTHCNVCLSDNCLKSCLIICPNCNLTCRSLSCLQRHQTRTDKGLLPCELRYKCLSCEKTWQQADLQPEDHRCGYYTCKNCREYVAPEHMCYTKGSGSSEKSRRKYIFADIETSQKDELLQCDMGYKPLSHKDCSQCLHFNETCENCQICQHCFKRQCGKYKHTVVLAVCQTACKLCEKKDLHPDSKCNSCGSRCQNCSAFDKKTKQFKRPPCPNTCGLREKVFKTLYDLGTWLFNENHRGYTVFFHNLSYDGSFLLQHLLSQSIRPSFVIYRGSKIQMFTLNHLSMRVIDSFNFLPMALSKLPKAFQLDSLAKGYFPHFFTSRENLKYVGPYPPAEMYGPNSMSKDGRREFFAWYDAKVQSGEIFDFQKEMLTYCRSDVDILRRACMTFKDLLREATESDGGTGVDAYDSCTIASLCMDVFKTKFLCENWRVLIKKGEEERWLEGKRINGNYTVLYEGKWIERDTLKTMGFEISKDVFVKSPIARPPPSGYHNQVQFSKKSIAWLELLRHRALNEGRTLDLYHALCGRGEYRVPGTCYSLDGYEPPNSQNPGGTAYEFHGCYYHGCPVCFPAQEAVLVPGTQDRACELLAKTRKKEKDLRALGMKVVSIWEHEFDALLASDDEARTFVETLDLVERLDPRDSLTGGRTNGCVLNKRTPENTKIKYVDFTSLYPFVNKTCRYPLGHPEIITREFRELSSYFGLAKVKILPPRGLYHPVLSYRTGGKLTFPLCRTCVERQQHEPCTCSEEQRALTGTYCTPELQKAMEKGYRLLKVYEVYHWDESAQYDPVTKSGGLFTSYINLFLKIKQEASGPPEWVKSESDLTKYIEMYEEREGIRLDPSKIQHNAGLRSLAKLLLNSFWGKFGQRMNLTKNQFLHDSEAHILFEMMCDPTIEIQDFNIVDDNHLLLSSKKSSETLCDPGHTNVFLASFTTCWARLKLYDLLDLLQRRVLYWDTDSVIYTQKEGEPEPPIGDYLGDLTNELSEGDWITEFICNGPKNYAYRTHQGKTACKVKGFSLNYTNSEVINLESMKDAMFNRENPHQNYQTVNLSKISRDKIRSEIYSQTEIKKYQAVYTKRVIQPNLTTLPYGF